MSESKNQNQNQQQHIKNKCSWVSVEEMSRCESQSLLKNGSTFLVKLMSVFPNKAVHTVAGITA